MITKPPKILAHISSLKNGNFITPEYILNLKDNTVNLLKRFCPHRMYPLRIPEKNIVCMYHGFEWTSEGEPLNNDKKLGCGSASIGRSGLIFKNFIEPAHCWVNDLANEQNLEFSHTVNGTSTGSWLWMMEIQTDLLHIRQGEDVVHPWLSSIENLDSINMDSGDGWIVQTCSTGWWLFIYPFTFVEWSKGCLAINYTIPKDIDNEFGFEWVTQFYYAPTTTLERKKVFEELENVFHEDVATIEKQKGSYFPLMKSQNRLEDHCVHFGKWYQQNI